MWKVGLTLIRNDQPTFKHKSEVWLLESPVGHIIQNNVKKISAIKSE